MMMLIAMVAVMVGMAVPDGARELCLLACCMITTHALANLAATACWWSDVMAKADRDNKLDLKKMGCHYSLSSETRVSLAAGFWSEGYPASQDTCPSRPAMVLEAEHESIDILDPRTGATSSLTVPTAGLDRPNHGVSDGPNSLMIQEEPVPLDIDLDLDFEADAPASRTSDDQEGTHWQDRLDCAALHGEVGACTCSSLHTLVLLQPCGLFTCIPVYLHPCLPASRFTRIPVYLLGFLILWWDGVSGQAT